MTEFDCARFTSDAAAIVDVLWAHGEAAAALVDSNRRLLACNPAAQVMLEDAGIVAGGTITEGVTQAWLDDETETSTVPVTLHDGSRGVVMVWQDITEHWLTERRTRREIAELESRVTESTEQLVRRAADLAAANAELEAFSYSVSHDLRAPLRAISGFARLLEELSGADAPAETRHYLHRLRDSAADMGRLIDGMLMLSRTQRAELTIERLDMTALVRECWEALAGERHGRDVGFELDDLPAADGDRRLIRQVWTNLLQNAITYTATRDQARVHVSGAIDDGAPAYAVQDNGVGFDMAQAGRIGQVFQRLHADPDFPGTGIGLAIVQRIVRRHGGMLSVQGEPDKGARMGFTLGAPR